MFAIEEAVFSTDVIGDTQEELKARISVHPFLAACRAGTIGRPRLNRLLTQHAKYGEHFTRFLSALMANLRSGDDCLRLAGTCWRKSASRKTVPRRTRSCTVKCSPISA